MTTGTLSKAPDVPDQYPACHELVDTEEPQIAHPLFDVTAFEIIGAYTLSVTFDYGATQVVDLEPVLLGELFGPLLDQDLFRQVRLDPEIKTLVWPNGADFDPYVLHEWPRMAGPLSQQLRAALPAN